ncbi:uncharacterized protein LOC134765420 isoform X2 [Penaeus indicus]|uniref:uncharacterized protein LOC134765420 isoform X2 n=1 Tax=Penaeus indicus TaxID=29960 RepID=UPI00300C8A61
MAPHRKRKKRPAFSEEELRVLLQEVSKRKKVLVGKFDVISVTFQSKVEAWDSVTEAINGVSRVTREREEVRRKFAHLKWFVKKKAKAWGRRGGKTSNADTLSDPEEAMLSVISETVSNSLSSVCESETPLSVCEDSSEAVSPTPLRSDTEDHSVGKNDVISASAGHSLRGLRNFRMTRREADTVQKLYDDTDGTPIKIENEETNPAQTDISDDVMSRNTMEGLRHFRIDKEEISKDQTMSLRYFRKEMKSSGNAKLTKKDHHSNSKKKLEFWSHEGVLQLVEAYRSHMHMFSMTSLNSSQIWCKIAEALQDSGYTYTGGLCKKKMQNLSTRYKSITENQENSRGRIRGSDWEYFDTMQDLFAGNASGDTSFETSLGLSLPTDPDDDPLQVDEVKTEQDCPSPEYIDVSLPWSGVKTEFCHSSSEPDSNSLSWDDVKIEESSLFPEPVEDLLPMGCVKVELCSSSHIVH